MSKLLPASMLPYAKAWVAFLGVVASAVIVSWPAAPKWLAVVSSVLTTVGVYLAPNGPADEEV